MSQTVKQLAYDLRSFLILSGEDAPDLDYDVSIVFTAEKMLGNCVVIIAPVDVGVDGYKYHMCVIDKESGLIKQSIYVYNAVEVIAYLVKYKREEKS